MINSIRVIFDSEHNLYMRKIEDKNVKNYNSYASQFYIDFRQVTENRDALVMKLSIHVLLNLGIYKDIDIPECT